MSKSSKKTEKQTTAKEVKSDKLLIPVKYQTLVALTVILVVFSVYYAPMYFGNETFNSGDIITSQSARSYVDNEHEEFTLWYPYIFCGMPGYAITVGYKWFNLMYVGLTFVKDIFLRIVSVDYAVWSLYLIILAITSYMLIEYTTKNKLIALFGGLSSAFTTGVVLLLTIGHVTKLTALCFFPLLLLVVLKFEKKITLKDIAILVIALQLSFQGWHVQIIFYMLFSIMIYYIYNIVFTLARKETNAFRQLIKSGVIFFGAFIVALLIQSDNLTQIYEYNPYSTRGTKSVLEKDAAETPKAESDFYQYATNWSFPPEEMSTFIIPSYMGFGKSEYKGPLTNNQPYTVNTYFGEIPLTENPMYMGVVVLFLALFGIYSNRKKRFVQLLTILSFISLLLSFGRYFPVLFDLMFYYFPFFDKFRVPITALIIIQLSLPVLAAYGIKSVIDLIRTKDEKQIKIIFYAAISFSILFLLSLIGSGGLKSWFAERITNHSPSDPRMAQQFKALSDYSSSMFSQDMMFAFGLLTVTFWLAYGTILKKIPQTLFLILIVGISFGDLARVNKRFEEYLPNRSAESLFVEPEFVKVIKNQNDSQPFRILNLKQDGSAGSFRSNSNFNAHFLLQDFYGYSAIKPRSYQDYMDVVGPTNQTLWRMLNVKYIISEQAYAVPFLRMIYNKDKTYVYEFTEALPRAYFVDSVGTATPIGILNNVKENKFDPKEIAYLYEPGLSVETPGNASSVKIIKYLDERIELEVTATGNNLLFLGDTYYPNGWHAYIDGNTTEILRVNHGFRGIMVPQGNHKIEFVYKPTSFVMSKYTSLFLSSTVLVLLILGVVIEKRKRNI